MPRSREVVRQWQVLRALAASRLGLTVDALAAEHRVTTRTVRRDLAALQRAGFPLYHDSDELPLRWMLRRAALADLDGGFTLMEVCALHFGKAAVEAMASSPLGDDLAGAMDRIERALPASMREFLDAVPSVVGVKAAPGSKRLSDRDRRRAAQLIDAALQRRMVRMDYDSASSGRVKEYVVEPHRIVAADGGMYLTGFVPEYHGRRTFAVERIRKLTTSDRRCVSAAEPGPVFPDSMGVHSSAPEQVVLEFSADAAEYVAGRHWHPGQVASSLPDGRLLLELRVSVDAALRRWVLGFGGEVRVVFPAPLAADVSHALDIARRRYAPRLVFDASERPAAPSQRGLPFADPPLFRLLSEKAS